MNKKLENLLINLYYDQATYCSNFTIPTISLSEIREASKNIRQYDLEEYFLELKRLGVR